MKEWLRSTKLNILSNIAAKVSAENQPKTTPTKVVPTCVVERYSFKL